jgi:hypothetical protein
MVAVCRLSDRSRGRWHLRSPVDSVYLAARSDRHMMDTERADRLKLQLELELKLGLADRLWLGEASGRHSSGWSERRGAHATGSSTKDGRHGRGTGGTAAGQPVAAGSVGQSDRARPFCSCFAAPCRAR